MQVQEPATSTCAGWVAMRNETCWDFESIIIRCVSWISNKLQIKMSACNEYELLYLLYVLVTNHQVTERAATQEHHRNSSSRIHCHHYRRNYLVCAPCRCSRIRGRSPGKVAAGPAPCVASYPCPASGTTPGRWGSSVHTWSPPGDVHILCCWWRKSGDHTQQGGGN